VVEVDIIDEVAQHLKKLFETIQKDIMHEWKREKLRPENPASVHTVERKVTLSVLAKVWKEIAPNKLDKPLIGEGDSWKRVASLVSVPAP